MSKELIVSAGKHETKVAILEDDLLVEIFHEREKEYSLAGSIHKGRVTRVLPGMQSAFVDIGLERDAFLYVSDFFEDNEEYDAVVSTVEEKVLKMEKIGGSPELIRPIIFEAPALEGGEEGVPATTPAAEAPREARPDRGGDRGGGDRGGDRGDRRGRRGRRRRGGRGPGGLPESKFFSPRADGGTDEKEERVEETEAEVPSEQPVVVSRFSAAEDDFMVLPGESLAKYVEHTPAPVGLHEPVDLHEDEPEEAVAEEVQAEPVAAAPEPDAVPLMAAPQPPPLPVSAVPPPLPQPPPLPPEPVVIKPEESAAETAAEGPEVDWAIEEGEPAAEAEPEAFTAEEDGEASETEIAPGSEEAPEEEGPEPARIPTSLTATLREQGHRYPHRVSRRMRRKMRGGEDRERPQGGGGQGGGAQVGVNQGDAPTVEVDGNVAPPEAAASETRAVEPREERRPERGGRDRGGRDRGNRGERGERPERAERAEQTAERTERPERERPPLPSIADLLKEGQEIIVQIAKEPLGQKGARITSHIALPGRFVVYMPTVDHAGVSRKIPSEEERHRLKRVLQTHRQGIPGGYICRTAAENKSEEELKSDMHFLYNLWLDMRQKAERKPAPVLLHHDLDLVQRILRDQLTTSFKTIWVDSEEYYESILRFVQRFQPLLVGRVKLYTRNNPIFDEFGITAELEKALRPKVWLKSGGYIVINQTEALVAIDINTGKYVGKSNRLEDTIVKVNTDAIKEIVRQIRVRDLGGIIVVDFIDMDERKNRQKVMQALEESMRADRAPYKILQFNDFGLVAITRKRVKQSLERTLCSGCPYCEGAGYIKSVQTVIGEILQEAQRMRKSLDDPQNNIVLRVNPEVAKVLKSNHNQFLQEIEDMVGKSVLVKSDPLLHQTKFDLA